jgi:hypothetical protein
MQRVACVALLCLSACGFSQATPGARVAKQPGVIERPAAYAPDVVRERSVECPRGNGAACGTLRPY